MRPYAAFAFAWMCAVVVVAAPLRAQDSHYWTVRYGPRASLLGGAVIGSVSDVSAAFYNPGGLAMADSLGFALSLNVFERTTTTAERGLVGEDDVSTSQAGLAPSMFGGAIKGPESGDHVIAYSLITRQRINSNISEVRTTTPAGYETLVSQVNLMRNASERWGGLSWAYAARPNFGIGATAFLSALSDSRLLRIGVAGSQAGEGVVAERVREFNYDHYGVIAKLGALLDYGWFAAGLTLTAPSFTVYGAGEVTYGDIDVLDGAGGPPPTIAVANQDDLDATRKQPFSVGLGLRVGKPSLQLYGSAEWFAPLDPYDVIRSGPFDPQSSTDQFDYGVIDERDSVFNWAIAADYRMSDVVTSYVSYSTDFSSRSDGSEATLVIAPWDIRSVSFGVDLRIRGRSLTFGGAYGWGGGTTRDLRDLVPAGSFDPPLDFEPTPISYGSFRLILGFEF